MYLVFYLGLLKSSYRTVHGAHSLQHPSTLQWHSRWTEGHELTCQQSPQSQGLHGGGCSTTEVYGSVTVSLETAAAQRALGAMHEGQRGRFSTLAQQQEYQSRLPALLQEHSNNHHTTHPRPHKDSARPHLSGNTACKLPTSTGPGLCVTWMCPLQTTLTKTKIILFFSPTDTQSLWFQMWFCFLVLSAWTVWMVL